MSRLPSGTGIALVGQTMDEVVLVDMMYVDEGESMCCYSCE